MCSEVCDKVYLKGEKFPRKLFVVEFLHFSKAFGAEVITSSTDESSIIGRIRHWPVSVSKTYVQQLAIEFISNQFIFWKYIHLNLEKKDLNSWCKRDVQGTVGKAASIPDFFKITQNSLVDKMSLIDLIYGRFSANVFRVY